MNNSNILEAARNLLRSEGVPGAEISVLITDDETIREYNRDFRAIDKSTDVLSFPLFDPAEIADIKAKPPKEGPLLGDLIISLDTAIRQADEFHIDLHEEISLLMVHGILHLLGYDDQDEISATIMREKENMALTDAGLRHRYWESM